MPASTTNPGETQWKVTGFLNRTHSNNQCLCQKFGKHSNVVMLTRVFSMIISSRSEAVSEDKAACGGIVEDKLNTTTNDSEVFMKLEKSHHILPLMRRRCCRKEPRTGTAPPSFVFMCAHVLSTTVHTLAEMEEMLTTWPRWPSRPLEFLRSKMFQSVCSDYLQVAANLHHLLQENLRQVYRANKIRL